MTDIQEQVARIIEGVIAECMGGPWEEARDKGAADILALPALAQVAIPGQMVLVPHRNALGLLDGYTIAPRQAPEAQADLVGELVAALRLALPILDDEFSSFGPGEPETRAIRAVRAALSRAEAVMGGKGEGR